MAYERTGKEDRKRKHEQDWLEDRPGDPYDRLAVAHFQQPGREHQAHRSHVPRLGQGEARPASGWADKHRLAQTRTLTA